MTDVSMQTRPQRETGELVHLGPVLLATKSYNGEGAPLAVARWLAEREGCQLDLISVEEHDESVARSVNERARECDARMIVVGTGQHDPIGRYIYGERALQIAASADRPVLVVPKSAIAAAPSVAVVAVDFSPASLRAAHAVLPLLAPGGRLIVVHVKPGVAPVDENIGWWNDAYERHRADDFAQFLRRLPRSPHTTYDSKFLRGDVVSSIVNYAAEQGAELIACGRLGHSLVARVLVGSVSSALVRSATCPVLIAPQLPTDSEP